MWLTRHVAYTSCHRDITLVVGSQDRQEERSSLRNWMQRRACVRPCALPDLNLNKTSLPHFTSIHCPHCCKPQCMHLSPSQQWRGNSQRTPKMMQYCIIVRHLDEMRYSCIDKNFVLGFIISVVKHNRASKVRRYYNYNECVHSISETCSCH